MSRNVQGMKANRIGIFYGFFCVCGKNETLIDCSTLVTVCSSILLFDGCKEFTGRHGFIRQIFISSGTVPKNEFLYTVLESIGTVGLRYSCSGLKLLGGSG